MNGWLSEWLPVLICGVYLLISLLTGIIPGFRVSRSVTGYVAGDRSMNTGLLYFVLGAAIFSSFAFLGAPGWAYQRGAAAYYIIAFGIVGIVPFYFFGPRARRLGQRFGFITQAEMLEYRFGNRLLTILLAVLSVVVFIPYLTLQMKGAGIILESISGGKIPAWMGAAATYGVVTAYVLFSGVMGVGWTNALQGMFMMVVAWFLGLYIPQLLHGGIGEMFAALTAGDKAPMLITPGLTGNGDPWTWGQFSSYVVVSGLGFFCWPHLFMKAFAARSDRAIRRTLVMYPTFQLFIVPILFIGFSAILAFPGVTPADSIVPFLLTRLDLPAWLVGMVCAGILAASMSSGDTILHAAASVGVRDGLRRIKTGSFSMDDHMDDHRERFWIRLLVVVLAATAYYFAVVSRVSIVALLAGAYGGVAQVFPLLAAAFYWPRVNGTGALAGLVCGVAVNILFLQFPELKPWALHEGIYGLAANVTAMWTVSLATQPPDHERAQLFRSI